MIGWISLHRKLCDNPLWTRYKFTPGQAWVDLLLWASHNDHRVMRDYGMLTVRRGQVLTSQLALAKRWTWHRETVSKFLRFLNTDNMADIETSKSTSTGYTLISIRNYDKYQSMSEEVTDIQIEEDTSIGTSIGAASERHPSGTINNGNKNTKKEHCQIPAGFADLWACYPGPKGPKGEAVKAYATMHPPENVVELLRKQLEYKTRCDKAGVFCAQLPHLFRWLKKERWTDEIPSNGHTPGQDVSKYPLL